MSYQEFSRPNDYAQAWASSKPGRQAIVVPGEEIGEDEDHLYLIQNTPIPTGGSLPIGARCPVSEASYIRIARMIDRLGKACEEAEKYGEDVFREPQ